MAEQFARHAVRAEIAKGMSLPSYEDFTRRKLPAQEGIYNTVDTAGDEVPPQLDFPIVSNQDSSPQAESGL